MCQKLSELGLRWAQTSVKICHLASISGTCNFGNYQECGQTDSKSFKCHFVYLAAMLVVAAVATSPRVLLVLVVLPAEGIVSA